MGVYHITYAPDLKKICLYFDGGCNFSCQGCIAGWYLNDCHLAEEPRRIKNRTLNIGEVMSYLKAPSFKKTIFLGKEPTVDFDFLPLAKKLKERYSTYNILITNGWKYIDNKVIDEVCVSIKAITLKLFKDFTGKNNPGQVLENFKRYVSVPDIKVRAESILIPNYIDIEEIEKIAQFIARVDFSIPYRIDAYVPDSKMDKFRRPTKTEVKKAGEIAKRYLTNVSILHYKVKVKHKVERIY